MIKKFFSLFIILLATSCAGLGIKYMIQDGRLPENLSENHGYLIGTMTSEGGEINRGIRFRSVSNPNINDLISRGTSVMSVNTDELFAFALPEGKYEMTDLYMHEMEYGAKRSWNNKHPFSIPFEIQPGRATYIGEIKNHVTTGKNMLGLPLTTGGYFSFNNSSSKDLQRLITKYPFIDRNKIIVAVPKNGRVDPSLIRFQENLPIGY